jgi:hypothetical protein
MNGPEVACGDDGAAERHDALEEWIGDHRAFRRFHVAGYTLRVATAGGTREARIAGPSTASWPSSHRQMKPTGT